MTTDGFAVILLVVSFVILIVGLALIRKGAQRRHEEED